MPVDFSMFPNYKAPMSAWRTTLNVVAGVFVYSVVTAITVIVFDRAVSLAIFSVTSIISILFLWYIVGWAFVRRLKKQKEVEASFEKFAETNGFIFQRYSLNQLANENDYREISRYRTNGVVLRYEVYGMIGTKTFRFYNLMGEVSRGMTSIVYGAATPASTLSVLKVEEVLPEYHGNEPAIYTTNLEAGFVAYDGQAMHRSTISDMFMTARLTSEGNV